MRALTYCCLLVGCLSGFCLTAADPRDSELPGNLASMFLDRCVVCHGPEKAEGGYRMDTFAHLGRPGDSALPPIVAGQPDQSELLRRLLSSTPEDRMPAEGPPLTPEQIQWVRRWIDLGAPLDDQTKERPLASWAPMSMRKASVPASYPRALPVTAIAMHASEALAPHVWTSGYGEVLQWELSDPPKAVLVQRQPVAGIHVRKLSLNHDASLLAVSSGIPGSQGAVEVFYRYGTNYRPVWSYRHADLPADLAFAPHENTLAIAQSDGALVIARWPSAVAESSTQNAVAATTDPPASYPPMPDQPVQLRTITPHADGIDCVAWSTTGDRLITGSRDRTAKIFRMPELDLIANYDRHERAVGGVAYMEGYPVSLDETGRLRLWSGDDNDRTVAEVDSRVRFLAPLYAGQQRLWLPAAGDLLCYQVERKSTSDGTDEKGQPKTKTVTRWKSEPAYLTSGPRWLLCVTQHAQWVAAGNEAGQVSIWKLGQAQAEYLFDARPVSVASEAVKP